MSQDEKRAGGTKRGPRQVWIGWEPRQHAAYAVCQRSVRTHVAQDDLDAGRIVIKPIILDDLQQRQLYTRPVDLDDKGRLFDPISGASMSTEFAISRFLVAALACAEKVKRRPGQAEKRKGWALFIDCDMLVRHRLETLFEICEGEPDKAVFCVQHQHVHKTDTKMDDQMQLVYARKNWTSVMAINLDHRANKDLTVDLINKVPGRDLHRFCWLEKHGDLQVIGALPQKWNHLVGYTEYVPNAAIVHYKGTRKGVDGPTRDARWKSGKRVRTAP